MDRRITIRLGKELTAWLKDTAAKTGVSRGKIIREELEKATSGRARQPFLRLAGVVCGPRDLSRRRGFSRRRKGSR